MTNTDTKFLDIALAHAKRGMRVFPIIPGRKSPPLFDEWQNKATTDEKQIREWWTQWPTANVGLECSGMVVVDCDVKKIGPDGLDGVDRFNQIHCELELEETYAVSSPSGGVHAYFRIAEGVKIANGTNVFGLGIDLRSAGGYVLAPGCATDAGEYSVLIDAPIADAAPELIALCKARTKDGGAPDGAKIEGVNQDLAEQRSVAYLHSLPAAGRGGRNNALMRAARKLGDFGLNVDRAVAVAMEHFKCAQPQGDEFGAEEIERTVRSAYRNREKPIGADSPQGMGFEKIPLEEQQSPAEERDRSLAAELGVKVKAKAQERLDLLTAGDVRDEDILGCNYFIKHWIERESNVLIFGKWSAGKTFVTLDATACIALGQSWFGQRVRQGKTLYLTYEGWRGFRKRLRALHQKYPELDKAPFAAGKMTHPLVTPEGRRQLIFWLQKFMAKNNGALPDIVVIDTLARAIGGDDAEANQIAQLERVVGEIMDLGCTVVRLHHPGHTNTERARGHSSLPAGIDTEIRITAGTNGKPGKIKLTKQRDDAGSRLGFKMKVVPLGQDEDGDHVTTCTVEQVSPDHMNGLTEAQNALMRIIRNKAVCGVASRELVLEVARDQGLLNKKDGKPSSNDGRTAFHKMLTHLAGDPLKPNRPQFIEFDAESIRLVDRGAASVFDGEGDDE